MNFKPTALKIILSILAIIAFDFINSKYLVSCIGVCAKPWTAHLFEMTAILMSLGAGILFYVIYSLVQKKNGFIHAPVHPTAQPVIHHPLPHKTPSPEEPI